MLSTPSYFKLKPQLRLAAEYDPSTYIEFELRCNSAASNLRYRTVLPQFALGNRYANLHREPRLMSLLSPHLSDGLPTTPSSTMTSAPVVPCTRPEGPTVGTRPIKRSRTTALNHLVHPFTGFHHRWLNPAPEDKPLYRAKRNRRVQPPRPACPLRTARPAFR